jgi:hypothetical protein
MSGAELLKRPELDAGCGASEEEEEEEERQREKGSGGWTNALCGY